MTPRQAVTPSPTHRRGRGRPAAVDRRQQILAATRRAVQEHGWAETSLRDIAAQAGIAPGLLSYYYPTKDELLIAVLSDVDAAVTGRWTAAMVGVDDPVARVQAGFQAAVSAFVEDPATFRLFLDLLSASTSNPRLQAGIRGLLDNTVALIAGEMEQAAAQWDVELPDRGEVDLAGAVAAAFDGVLLHAAVRDVDPRPAFRALEQMLIAQVVALPQRS